MFKESTFWSVHLLFCAIQQRVSVLLFTTNLFTSISMEIAAMQKNFGPLYAVCDNHKSFSNHIPTDITKPRVALAGLYRHLCMSALVYVYMWLSKGSIHAVSRVARYCKVTVDLFSRWLLLLEAWWAHKSWGLILLNHSESGGLWLQWMLQPNFNNFQKSPLLHCVTC